MKKLIIAGVVALAVVLGYANWERIEPLVGPLLGAPATPAASAEIALPDAPAPRIRRVALDATLSTDGSFREAMKAQLVAAMAAYLPPRPEATKDGVAEVVGLDLVVKIVGTSPLTFGQPDYAITVPSVPALPPRPSSSGDAFDPLPLDQWRDAEEAWSEQYDAAVAAAEGGVATLEAMQLDLDERSAVTETVAALSLVTPATGDRAYMVLSDVDENEPQQPAALAGAPVYVVQPDPYGDVATWDRLFSAFSAWCTASGASTVEHSRPELAADVIRVFLNGA